MRTQSSVKWSLDSSIQPSGKWHKVWKCPEGLGCHPFKWLLYAASEKIRKHYPLNSPKSTETKSLESCASHPAWTPKLTSAFLDENPEENDYQHEQRKSGAKPQSPVSITVPKAAAITRGARAVSLLLPLERPKAEPAPGMSLTLSTIYPEASTLPQVWAYKRSALEQGTAGSGQAGQKLHCLGRQSARKALKSSHRLMVHALSSFWQWKYFCWNLTSLGSQATSFQGKALFLF